MCNIKKKIKNLLDKALTSMYAFLHNCPSGWYWETTEW